MIQKLLIIVLVQSCVALAKTNFEDDSIDHVERDIFNQHLRHRNQKKPIRFDDIKNDKIQLFFETFRFELSNQDVKQFYRKLDDLATDTERYVEVKAFVSDKEVNEFIDNGLKIVHKEFMFQKASESFFQKAKRKF